jgi:hypothetical protein
MVGVHYIEKESLPDAEYEANLEILRSQIQDADADQILCQIEHLEFEWGLHKRGDSHAPIRLWIDYFCRKDELNEDGIPTHIDVGRVSSQYRRQVDFLGRIYHRAFALNLSETSSIDINKNEFTVAARINRLIRIAAACVRMTMSYSRIYEYINNPTGMPENADCDPALFDASTMQIEELSSYQQLILVVLNETYNNNIRRYKGQCCKEIEIIDGKNRYRTKAWKPVMPIGEYVYSIAQKENRFEVWKNLTAKGNTARDAIRHLSECRDMQFPEIVKNRNVWSFNNGLFVGKEWSTKTGQYVCKFYPYNSPDFSCLDPTIVSAKYFDKHFPNFDHIENWYDIPTPHFQAILDYQKFDEDVCKWMYVMGGRLCFDVSDIDSWQIIPFLKGIARSGKSTLITKVFKKFYDSEDVRTLSNNIERKFGLSSLYDGFMFIAPEVKGDLCLEQAEFQSLVSGEDVSIAVKHEKAKSVEWKTPGILGGNEVPNWKDNSGSVLRRLIPWNFARQVKEADPHLDEKLDIELPAILFKCIKGYLEFAQKYSNQDIWNVVPPYFKIVQNQVAMVTNTLHNFLASPKLRYGKDLFIPKERFVQMLNEHCTTNFLTKTKFNPDFYNGPFSSRDLEVRMDTRVYKGMPHVKQEFIFGVDEEVDQLMMNSVEI